MRGILFTPTIGLIFPSLLDLFFHQQYVIPYINVSKNRGNSGNSSKIINDLIGFIPCISHPFGESSMSNKPCMVYLPTCSIKINQPNVGKYTIHGFSGVRYFHGVVPSMGFLGRPTQWTTPLPRRSAASALPWSLRQKPRWAASAPQRRAAWMDVKRVIDFD